MKGSYIHLIITELMFRSCVPLYQLLDDKIAIGFRCAPQSYLSHTTQYTTNTLFALNLICFSKYFRTH